MCRVVACSRGAGERYGIESTRMPGMTSSNAPHSQPTATEHAESVDGLERIVGTGRVESASGTEKRAHGPLVYSNQERGSVAHCAFYYSILRLATRIAATGAHSASIAGPLRFRDWKLARHALPQRAQALA
jgi:hypothetical protein